MKWLVSVRDSLKKIYAEYDFIMRPVIKFLFCLLCLALLKNRIGVSDTVCRPVVILVLAAVSAVFPAGFISLECFAFVIANIYKASLSMFLLATVLFLFTVLLYFGFRPGKGILIILIPIGFMLKIPYVFPVILGLSYGISAVVPVAIGVIAWKLIDYFSVSYSDMIYTTNVDTLISEFVRITKDIFTDKNIYVTLIAFIACIVLVGLISRMNINHSWTIGVLAGAVILSAIRIAGSTFLNNEINILTEVIYFITAALTALAYELLFFAVDYKATEHLQFEDEDYYYYVKAVPKINSSEMTERRE